MDTLSHLFLLSNIRLFKLFLKFNKHKVNDVNFSNKCFIVILSLLCGPFVLLCVVCFAVFGWLAIKICETCCGCCKPFYLNGHIFGQYGAMRIWNLIAGNDE